MIRKFTRFMEAFREEMKEWFEHYMIRNIPGRIGKLLRYLYWSRQFHDSAIFFIDFGCIITSPRDISIGENVSIMHNCYFCAHNNGSIKIGARVRLNSNVMLGAADNGQIIIGNDVLIGPNVVFRASNHKFSDLGITIYNQGHTGGKIVIEDDVWIGANVVILPNTTIGKGAIIGAGAVVTKSIPSYSLACGVPAKVIKENCRV